MTTTYFKGEAPDGERENAVKELRYMCEEFISVGYGGQTAESILLTDLHHKLWDLLSLFQNHPFYTAKNLEFTYIIRGGEMFISRKEKSITQSTVFMALKNAMELDCIVTGPKKLGIFGASYLWPVFKRIGVLNLGN